MLQICASLYLQILITLRKVFSPNSAGSLRYGTLTHLHYGKQRAFAGEKIYNEQPKGKSDKGQLS